MIIAPSAGAAGHSMAEGNTAAGAMHCHLPMQYHMSMQSAVSRKIISAPVPVKQKHTSGVQAWTNAHASSQEVLQCLG